MVNRDTDIASRIKALRKEYRSGYNLSEELAHQDPFLQFTEWFEMAEKAGLLEPNAMALASATDQGIPSLRMLLMKEYSAQGFVFYTNYLSRKGKELEQNPRAAILFFWGELERQVRIEGEVSKVEREKSEAYFASRPRGAQLGAAVSAQSSILISRDQLELERQRLDQLYADQAIPCPATWGGYLLKPEVFEFWQGQENRLHDRLRYRLIDQNWKIERLSP